MTTGQKVFLVLGGGTVALLVLPKLLAPKAASSGGIVGTITSLASAVGVTPSTIAAQIGSTKAGGSVSTSKQAVDPDDTEDYDNDDDGSSGGDSGGDGGDSGFA